MIRFDQVEKNLPNQPPLMVDGLEIAPDAVCGILGTSVLEQDALCRLAAGVYAPDHGFVTLENQPIYENPRAKLSLMMVSSAPALPSRRSLKRCMEFYGRYSPRFDGTLGTEMLERLALSPSQNAEELSEEKRAAGAIALAICCKPDYLILDRTLDDLAPPDLDEVLRLLKEVRPEGGILIATQKPERIQSLCTHAAMLKHHALAFSQDLSALLQNYRKVRMDFGEALPADGFAGLDCMAIIPDGGRVDFILKGDYYETIQKLKCYLCQSIEDMPLTLEEIDFYEKEVSRHENSAVSR